MTETAFQRAVRLKQEQEERRKRRKVFKLSDPIDEQMMELGQAKEAMKADRYAAERTFRSDVKNASPAQLARKYGFQFANDVQRERRKQKILKDASRKEVLGPPAPVAKPKGSGGGFVKDVADFAGFLLGGGGGQGTNIATIGANIPIAAARATTRVVPLMGLGVGNTIIHPQSTSSQGIDLLKGLVRLGSAATSKVVGQVAHHPTDLISLSELQDAGELAWGAIAEDVRYRYGKPITDPEARKRAKDQSLLYALDALAAANVAGRAVGIGTSVAKGATWRAAVKGSFVPETLGKTRRVASPALAAEGVFYYGRSPVMRTAQRAIDFYSQVRPAARFLGADRRVARRLGTNQGKARMALNNSVNTVEKEIAELGTGSTRDLLSWMRHPRSTAFPFKAELTPEQRRLRLEYETPYKYRSVSPDGLATGETPIAAWRQWYQHQLSMLGPATEYVNGVKAVVLKPDIPSGRRSEWVTDIENALRHLDEMEAVDTTSEKFVRALNAMDDADAAFSELKVRAFSREPGATARKIAENERALRAGFYNRQRLIGREVFYDADAPGGYATHMIDWRPKNPSSGAGFSMHEGTTVLSAADTSRAMPMGKNEMVNMMRGALGDFDPYDVTLTMHQTANVVPSNQIRGLLWDAGKPIKVNLHGLDLEGKLFVKQRSRDVFGRGGSRNPQIAEAIGANAGQTVRRLKAIEDVIDDVSEFIEKHVMDAQEIQNAQKLARSLPEGLPLDHPLVQTGWLDPQGNVMAHAGIREIDVKTADRLIYYFGGKEAKKWFGRTSKSGAAVDFIMNLQRMNLLYLNPGYYLANLGGNMMLKLLSRGVFGIEDMVRDVNLWRGDQRLWTWVAGEMGEGLAGAPMRKSIAAGTGKKTQAFNRYGLRSQQRLGETAGRLVDADFRVSQWISTARSIGLPDWDDWHALRTGENLTPNVERVLKETNMSGTELRRLISDRAQSKMVDFSTMEPWERAYMTRFLFVYPWQRGITKYLIDYAASYPERSALLAMYSAAINDEWEARVQGHDVPLWLQGAWPEVDEKGNVSMTFGQSLTPWDTPLNIARSVEAAFGFRDFPEWGVDRPIDYLHPLFQDVLGLMNVENRYDKRVAGYSDLDIGSFASIIPGATLASSLGLGGGPGPSKVYTDRSREETIKRWLFRFGSRDINMLEAEKQARKAGTANKSREQWSYEEYLRKYQPHRAPAEYRDRIKRGYMMKARYEAARDSSPIEGDKTAYQIAMIMAKLWDETNPEGYQGKPLVDTLTEIKARNADADPDGSGWRNVTDQLRDMLYDSSLLNRWQAELRRRDQK